MNSDFAMLVGTNEVGEPSSLRALMPESAIPSFGEQDEVPEEVVGV